MTAEKQSALQTIEEKRDLVIEIADRSMGICGTCPFRNSSQQKLYCDALEAEGFEVERGISRY